MDVTLQEDDMKAYYMLMEEWLYTTESGRDPVDVTFDSRKEALEYARGLTRDEVRNFSDHNKVDCLLPEEYSPCCGDRGGFIITCRNGLDEWYYAVRVFKVNPLSRFSPKSVKSTTTKGSRRRRRRRTQKETSAA